MWGSGFDLCYDEIPELDLRHAPRARALLPHEPDLLGRAAAGRATPRSRRRPRRRRSSPSTQAVHVQRTGRPNQIKGPVGINSFSPRSSRLPSFFYEFSETRRRLLNPVTQDSISIHAKSLIGIDVRRGVILRGLRLGRPAPLEVRILTVLLI